MQKISPLKTSLEAFRKFKTERNKNIEFKNNSANSNPFGITFKGTVLQMDVFESAGKKAPNIIQEKMKEVGRLTASVWTGTINRFSSIKENAIQYFGKIKNGAKDIFDKLNKDIEFDFMKYNVSNLVKKPVSELSEMLKKEIAHIGG